ncbi:MAG: HesA/MoeB/ThiF family protein [Saprospiraceae bacterium]|nr:HesA/MoeB/ThiF family protein [Saprospiraceae bacterium]MBK9042444.1 HesA/MoeB/ThiF family protein [Saprospiraceae bacterium]
MGRYQRQIQLSDFGQKAQNKISQSKVLVIGAGGLGCPVIMTLTAMGVGHIGIMDGDIVEITNLHRQYLYTEKDLNKLKTVVALQRLGEMNSEVHLESFPFFATAENLFSVIQNFDIIIDGTDQIPTRYLINDVCCVLKKPLVYGSVFRHEGQVSVFNVVQDGILSTNYRDLFPFPEKTQNTLSCNEAGVTGILPNLIGGFMANEAVKLITGVGKPLINKVLYYNSKTNFQSILQVSKNPENTYIFDKEVLETYGEKIFCNPLEVEDINQILTHLKDKNQHVLVDVREENERPILPFGIKIPLNQLSEKINTLEKFNTLVFICQSGVRSAKALEWAQNNLSDTNVYHYKYGAAHFIKYCTHGN